MNKFTCVLVFLHVYLHGSRTAWGMFSCFLTSSCEAVFLSKPKKNHYFLL